jgi:glycosyltransferase involved in cell wall biosynthesis
MTLPEMTRRKRIFACSSVALDYFAFLVDSLGSAATTVVPVTALTEHAYRRASRSSRRTRALLRVRMYVVYPFLLVAATFRARRGDAFVVTSNTFFAPAIVAVLAGWRGIQVVHLLYDLYPDAIEVAGRMQTGGLASRLIGCVTRLNQHQAAGTVYLGDFLRDYAERRWGETRRPGVIPIATDVRLYQAAPPPAGLSPLRMHYGGQLGLMHDADSLVEGLHLLARDGALGKTVAFDGLLSGSRAPAFEAALRGTPGVIVGGTLPSDAWRRHVERAHVGVVTLSPGGATVCLPSKTYAMMAAGLAIVAICPAWSDLARLIEEFGAGWVINNSPCQQPLVEANYVDACRACRPTAEVAADFREKVQQLVAEPALVQQSRHNAIAAIRSRFSPEQIAEKWAGYLQSLPAGGRRG